MLCFHGVMSGIVWPICIQKFNTLENVSVKEISPKPRTLIGLSVIPDSPGSLENKRKAKLFSRSLSRQMTRAPLLFQTLHAIEHNDFLLLLAGGNQRDEARAKNLAKQGGKKDSKTITAETGMSINQRKERK